MKTVALRLEDSVRNNNIPFEITTAEDPFYSESNMRHLQRSKEQIKQGKVVVKTMKELEIMANE